MGLLPLDAGMERDLARICARSRVRRLWLFGSAVTGAFDPARSDVDVLVEFQHGEAARSGRDFLNLLVDLEDLFGRRVDLLERKAMRNPYIIADVERTKRIVYGPSDTAGAAA